MIFRLLVPVFWITKVLVEAELPKLVPKVVEMVVDPLEILVGPAPPCTLISCSVPIPRTAKV